MSASPIKSTPPASPFKRSVGENTINSSPKRQRLAFDEESADQTIQRKASEILPKMLSERSQKVIALVAAIKSQRPVKRASLASYIEERNIEGLKAAFNPMDYFTGNTQKINELRAAVMAAKSLPHEKELRLALAELIVQIEDLDLLSRDEFIEFIKHTCGSNEDSHPVLRLLVDEFAFNKGIISPSTLRFISPIKNRTMLHYAAYFAKLSAYNLLVDYGLDPAQEDVEENIPIRMMLQSIGASSYTASHLASFFRQFYSYKRQPDSKERSEVFRLFLQDAIENSSHQIVPLAIHAIEEWKGPWGNWRAKIAPKLKLEDSSLGRHALQDSLDQNFDLNQRDSNGQTLLHWAVVMQNLPLIQALLQTDLPSKKDIYGRCALHIAASIPHIEPLILQLLKEATPHSETVRDNFKMTALDLALEGDLYDNFSKLHRLGCKTAKTRTCALWYSATNNLEAFRTAFDKPSDLTHYAKLLHFAIALGHHSIVDECLLKDSINWHLPDKLGVTPFAMAIEREDKALAKRIFKNQTNFCPPFPRKTAIGLIQLSFQHPSSIDISLSTLPFGTLTQCDALQFTVLDYIRLYGGPAVRYNLCQSLERIEKKTTKPK